MEDLSKIIDSTLNSVNRNTRDKFSEIVKDPLFTPVYDVSIRNQKEVAQKRLKKIADSKLVSVKDFKTNPENIFTMHELVYFFFNFSSRM
jgi:acyl-CoA oxidase